MRLSKIAWQELKLIDKAWSILKFFIPNRGMVSLNDVLICYGVMVDNCLYIFLRSILMSNGASSRYNVKCFMMRYMMDSCS